jgi:hypothetical protein
VIVMPEQGALQHPVPLRFKADWGGAPLCYPIDYRLARATALDLHPAAALEYQEADRVPTQVA